MKKIILSVFAALALTSCGDFLEEYSTDQRYCETAQDLEDLMIGEAFMPTYATTPYFPGSMGTDGPTSFNWPYINVLDDDAEMFMYGNYEQTSSTCSPLHVLKAMYRWDAIPCRDDLNTNWTDGAWTKVYKCIGAINAIIFQTEKITPKNDADALLMKHVRGEAHFLRAFYYMQLANVYGLPYSKATAANDFCVPLKVSETVEDRYFTRNNCAEVWNQIAADADVAAECLKGYNPDSKLRAGYFAAKALQSRIALFMEDYDKVVACAEELEKSDYELTDLNNFAGQNILCKTSKDVIFTMSQNEIPFIFGDEGTGYDYTTWESFTVASCFKSSNSLLESYDSDDLRLTQYFRRTSIANAAMANKYRTWNEYNDTEGVSTMFLLRYAEVLLNKAEAQAMLGKTAEAKNTLHALRAKRFASVDDGKVPSDEASLVNFVRDERRRELCFEGHRWFDLRRYSVNSKYPLDQNFAIKHACYAYDASAGAAVLTGNYVLESYAKDKAAWVIPIPDETIYFNRGEITNLERKDRQITK
ncbi:MAG: RagB/SusD family nutrient uptake outer membrane protein [Prevotella sp.]|nr:RagB/SusD family nutrient uptake outer membrane protein [Prevotella sp.]